MSRQKKDSIPICYRIEKSVYERLQAYAEDKGQTMTMAVERLLTKALDADLMPRRRKKKLKNLFESTILRFQPWGDGGILE